MSTLFNPLKNPKSLGHMSFNIDFLILEVKKEQDIVKKVKLLNDAIRNNDLKILDVAKKLAVSSSYVCHLLRLKKLPEILIDGYYAKNVSITHLFIISRLKDSTSMLTAYEQVLADNLSVQRTEELIRDMLYKVKSTGDYLSGEEKNKIVESLKKNEKNIDIKIIQTRIKSKLVLEFKGNLEETGKKLKAILEFLQSSKLLG